MNAGKLNTGWIGLTVALAVNLAGWFVFHRHASEFFSPAWWSAWFPNYMIWFVLGVAGFVRGGRAVRDGRP